MNPIYACGTDAETLTYALWIILQSKLEFFDKIAKVDQQLLNLIAKDPGLVLVYCIVQEEIILKTPTKM